jgi:hypothetical protein
VFQTSIAVFDALQVSPQIELASSLVRVIAGFLWIEFDGFLIGLNGFLKFPVTIGFIAFFSPLLSGLRFPGFHIVSD